MLPAVEMMEGAVGQWGCVAASMDALVAGMVLDGANDTGVGGMSTPSLGKLHPRDTAAGSKRDAGVDVGPSRGPSPVANALGVCIDICTQHAEAFQFLTATHVG